MDIVKCHVQYNKNNLFTNKKIMVLTYSYNKKNNKYIFITHKLFVSQHFRTFKKLSFLTRMTLADELMIIVLYPGAHSSGFVRLVNEQVMKRICSVYYLEKWMNSMAGDSTPSQNSIISETCYEEFYST